MKEFSAANCEKPKDELAVEMLAEEKRLRKKVCDAP